MSLAGRDPKVKKQLNARKRKGTLFQSLTFFSIIIAITALAILLANVYQSATLLVPIHAFFESQGASLAKNFITDPPDQFDFILIRNIDDPEKRNEDFWSQPQRRDAIISFLNGAVRTQEDLWQAIDKASGNELVAAEIRWVPSESNMFGDLSNIKDESDNRVVQIDTVLSGSLAELAGFQDADIITHVDGVPVWELEISARRESKVWLKILRKALEDPGGDARSTLSILRDDQPMDLEISGILSGEIEVHKRPLAAISYFISEKDSVQGAELAGVITAIYGTLWIVGLTALISFPLGIGAAIYLEEYAKKGRITNIIQVNIANLAGVPSVVYGIIGLEIIARGGGLFPPLGRTIIAGALTLSLLILPVIVISSREALRAVPDSMREAAFGVGASRWQVVRSHVLPYALPGAFTGVILALSRAIGETAPLVLLGAFQYVPFVPDSITDKFTVLPIQIWTYISRSGDGYENLGSVAILVLLVIMLGMNAIAIILRNRLQRKW